MSALRFVTLCTRSRLAAAAVLARSLELTHPRVPRLLILAERDVRPGDSACGWEVRPVSTLPLPGGARFLFQYSPFELCCALKPFALEAALGSPGAEGAVYLDTDMWALSPFLDLLEAAWKDADVWLTPHLHTMKPSPGYPALLHTGSYNAGFLAVANRPEGRKFLAWFQQRLERDCVQDFRDGLFVDQKWLDLAAATCPGVRPLRFAGLNVGHWNLHEHGFEERSDGSLWLDGEMPLALFHFSGLTGQALSRHGVSDGPPCIRALADRYRHALEGQAKFFPMTAEYSFSRFDDGEPIQPHHREAVRRRCAETADPFGDRGRVERASSGLLPPVPDGAGALQADLHLRRLRAHPVIGRVWSFWKYWVNHDLP